MNAQDKHYKRRNIFVIIVLFLVTTIYIFRLVDWQIINGKKYFEIANRNNIFTVKTEPLRGEILDSDGNPFAKNILEYNVVIDRFAINKDEENKILKSLIELFREKNEEFVDELPIKVDEKTKKFVFVEDKEKEIQKLKGKDMLNLNSYATAEDCINRIFDRFNCYDEKDLFLKRDIASVKYNMLKKGYYQAMNTSYIFAKDISSQMLSIVCEKYQGIAGIRISLSSRRDLMNADVIPHAIGFTGKMSKEQYENTFKDKEDYTIEDIVGKSGLEASMENYLRGKRGEKKIEISKDGKLLNAFETIYPEPGKTIFLTINSGLQRVANASLEKYVKMARGSAGDCKAAGVAAIDPRNGSILALATYPNYDAKRYLEDKNYYNEISGNKAVPIFSRALNGIFPPGSTFKPLDALAALQEGRITEKDTVTCHRIYYYPGANFTNKCLGNHGTIPLKTAMARSCNVYFSEIGRRAGIENLNKYCKLFGLGVKTGIELPESVGVIAGPEHSKAVGKVWDKRVTIKASIGQSDNLFSPLQLATYVSTIANGGHRYRSHIVKKITDYKREKVILENSNENPEIVTETNVSPENIGIVKEAMRAVVTGGTAAMFSRYRVPIAAKTGTAQCTGSDHTLFICFAPYENPEIAVAVVIEHGAKGFASKGVAKDILDAYFSKR